MNKVFGGAITLGLAAILSAAPQTGSPDMSQPVPAKHAATHSGKKHSAHQKAHNTHKGKTQSAAVTPGK